MIQVLRTCFIYLCCSQSQKMRLSQSRQDATDKMRLKIANDTMRLKKTLICGAVLRKKDVKTLGY